MASMDQIKELRDKTGISVMQCSKALEQAGGDMDKALAILKEKSADIAAKKGDRTLGAGAVGSYVHSNGTIGSMVLLMSETDFVSKNKEFTDLARDIAMHVVAMNPEYLKVEDVPEDAKVKARELFEEEAKSTGKTGDMLEKIIAGKLDAFFKEKALMNQSYIKNPDVTIQGLLDGAVQKFGENVTIVKVERLSVK